MLAGATIDGSAEPVGAVAVDDNGDVALGGGGGFVEHYRVDGRRFATGVAVDVRFGGEAVDVTSLALRDGTIAAGIRPDRWTRGREPRPGVGRDRRWHPRPVRHRLPRRRRRRVARPERRSRRGRRRRRRPWNACCRSGRSRPDVGSVGRSVGSPVTSCRWAATRRRSSASTPRAGRSPGRSSPIRARRSAPSSVARCGTDEWDSIADGALAAQPYSAVCE